MLIVCPQCESRYEIADATVPETGRTVRCARCRTEWTVTPAGNLLPEMADWSVATNDFDGTAEGADAAPTLHGVPNLPPLHRAPTAAAAAPAGGGMSVEQAAARGAAPARPKKAPRKPGALRRMLPSGRAVLIVGALACLVGVAVFRQAIVRAVPATAGLYAAVGVEVNLRGLAFEGVHTSRTSEGGVPVLVVEGSIKNITRNRLDMPRLKLAIRDGDGLEIYGWTTLLAKKSLDPGDSMAFRSRLASPPDGHDVAIRFARREDLLLKPKAAPLPAAPAPPEAAPEAPTSAPAAPPDHAPEKAHDDGHAG